MSAAMCRIDGVDTVVVNARDVTADDRTRQEHAAILQRASIGIAFTRAHHIASANPCFERMFGWDDGALAGQPMAVVWPDLDADAADPSLQQLARPDRAGGARAPDDASRRQPLLVPPARRCAGGRQPAGRRHHLVRRRRDRSPSRRAGHRRRARCRRGREPRQERVPGQHEPRDPHAAQRPARPGAAGDARWRRRAAAQDLHGAHPGERRGAVGHAVRHPRPVEDRSRQARTSTARRFACAMRSSRCAVPTWSSRKPRA